MKRAILLLVALCFCIPGTASAIEVIVGLPYGKYPIGHTAVRVNVGDPDREVIYDFGRYGKTWGHLRFHGEGIMRVWRGSGAVRRYLQAQQSFRDSVGYRIAVSPEEEARIYKYYEGLLANARWVKDYPDHKRYRLADDYNGIYNQCTSISLEGLKKIWERDRWETILPPRFNRGQGFNPATREYFYRVQREKGINEVVVPLDVIDALEDSHRKMPEVVTRVVRYPRQ
jgi:hypothetical protein